MKKILLLVSVALFAMLAGFRCSRPNLHRSDPDAKKSPEPLDYLWAQRAFPYGSIPSGAYYAALKQTRDQVAARGFDFAWQSAGPVNIGGRITDVAMHSFDLQTIYAATASGGIWKSADAGNTWNPISDALPSLSIGDIAIDPSDPHTLYAGTGEPNGGGGSITYDGRGVFKSENGGLTWNALGLEETGSIGRIEVDPLKPNRIFVAAMGHLFGNNPDRGVFRSEDGGQHWEKTLFVNDSTGAVDLAINPKHPDTVFAVTWQRTRRPNKRVYGGPGCGIWRSTDGGSNWNKLSAGLPSSNLGRIGIAISPSEPNILYAIYADLTGNFKGVYKSTNNGDSWSLLSGGDPGYPGFGWWFGQIRVDPNNANEVYTLGLDWLKSNDGGQTWGNVSEYLHADYHALYLHPSNPDLQIVGNDGGIYLSQNAGLNWDHRTFPVTQFYTSEINFQSPELFSGGAQDNGTWRSQNGGLDDWEQFAGGDGFVTLTNPENPTLSYAESQYGGFSGSNGATAPPGSRFNWNSPYVFDPHDPDIMYFGAEKLFRSSNGGLNWTAISNDLSNGPTGQNGVQYGTITTISVSPLDAKVIWVGTDDGNVWVTVNGGTNWTKVSVNLPKRWISRVTASLTNVHGALVCLSGYRHFDDMAHIYQTMDEGQSWQNVSSNLPDIPVNDLIIDPSDPDNVWLIATDAGVYFTSNKGQSWYPLNTGMPLVPVTDLSFHAPSRHLLAATFGRSMYWQQLPNLTIGTNTPQNVDFVQLMPNPVKTQASLFFSLKEKEEVSIRLYDLSGKWLQNLYSGVLEAGEHSKEIDGAGLSAGIYLLKMEGKNGAGFCKKLLKQ